MGKKKLSKYFLPHTLSLSLSTESTLSRAVVKTKDDSTVGYGICTSCVFIKNSRGIGCAMKLHNGKSRFFNMSR